MTTIVNGNLEIGSCAISRRVSGGTLRADFGGTANVAPVDVGGLKVDLGSADNTTVFITPEHVKAALKRRPGFGRHAGATLSVTQ